MQSILVYGRLLTRAVVSGVCNCSSTSSSSSSSAEVKTNNAAVANLRKRTAEYRDLRLLTAQCGFPKDFNNGLAASVFRNKAQFGDDACFSAKYKTADVIGVADGVGGWRSYGVDPSLFSFSLMQTCERLVSTGRFNPRAPAGIIAASYYELLENKEQIIGSSTACVLVLNRLDQKMYTANIGDSGFLVLREGHIVHRSEEQQHYFNTPFQLSVPPPEVSGQVLSDSPESAVTSSFNVQEGDLILLATDGLFDNLTDSMIVRELSGLQDHRTENIQKVVNSLAYQAWRLGFDSNYLSPFAQRAREYGIDAIGGKPDDITVLLASVGLGDQCSQFETTFAQSNCTDYG